MFFWGCCCCVFFCVVFLRGTLFPVVVAAPPLDPFEPPIAAGTHLGGMMDIFLGERVLLFISLVFRVMNGND